MDEQTKKQPIYRRRLPQIATLLVIALALSILPVRTTVSILQPGDKFGVPDVVVQHIGILKEAKRGLPMLVKGTTTFEPQNKNEASFKQEYPRFSIEKLAFNFVFWIVLLAVPFLVVKQLRRQD